LRDYGKGKLFKMKMRKKLQRKRLHVDKKHIRITLFTLAGAFLLAAASIFLVQWNE
jgi:hypothetical protein